MAPNGLKDDWKKFDIFRISNFQDVEFPYLTTRQPPRHLAATCAARARPPLRRIGPPPPTASCLTGSWWSASTWSPASWPSRRDAAWVARRRHGGRGGRCGDGGRGGRSCRWKPLDLRRNSYRTRKNGLKNVINITQAGLGRLV